jgi:hypothetical protein
MSSVGSAPRLHNERSKRAVVVKKWVELWRWQSKVAEKKGITV